MTPGFSEQMHTAGVISIETQGREISRSKKFRRGKQVENADFYFGAGENSLHRVAFTDY